MAQTASESWDTYWQGGGSRLAGGVNLPVVETFWQDLFANLSADRSPLRLLDIATGDGAVARLARAAGEPAFDVTATDISGAAVQQVQDAVPGANVVEADAQALPFSDGDFDVVTSQFGIEYAGPAAFSEAARLVSAGGTLACIIHIADGAIYMQYQDNLLALSRLRESAFLGRAADLFQHGFAAVRGADRESYDDAGSRLAPAVEAVERILGDFGPAVADGTVAKVYNDVARMHSRIQAYDPDEVMTWVNRMQEELAAYETRTRTVAGAAMSVEVFERICHELSDASFEILRNDKLAPGNSDAPVAWVLVARKPA